MSEKDAFMNTICPPDVKREMAVGRHCRSLQAFYAGN